MLASSSSSPCVGASAFPTRRVSLSYKEDAAICDRAPMRLSKLKSIDSAEIFGQGHTTPDRSGRERAWLIGSAGLAVDAFI